MKRSLPAVLFLLVSIFVATPTMSAAETVISSDFSDLPGAAGSQSSRSDTYRGTQYFMEILPSPEVVIGEEYFIGIDIESGEEIISPPVSQAATIDLDSPQTELTAGDSFILDLLLSAAGSRNAIGVYVSVEIGELIPTTLFLTPNLQFATDRVPVVSDLTPVDSSARIFGPNPSPFAPSLFGELMIPPNLLGSFTFSAEVVDARHEASISTDRITVNVG